MYKLLIFVVFLTLGACSQYKPQKSASSSNLEIQDPVGMNIYQQHCIACHGRDGTGALAGVPDLTQVAGFNSKTNNRTDLFKHIEHVKKGLKRPGDPMAMPAHPNLTEQDVEEVLKYMQQKFTHY